MDRRKVSSKLYDNVVKQKKFDLELVAFVDMVNQLRKEYRYDDLTTNLNHVIATEFDYIYNLDTSIKIIVHPSLKCLIDGEMGQIDGYGPPIQFTENGKNLFLFKIIKFKCGFLIFFV